MKFRYMFRFLVFILLSVSLESFAQNRKEISFNEHWRFQGKSVSGLQIDDIVNLPHSWNTHDAQQGIKYFRGVGQYTKTFDVEESWINHRVFIRFEGANVIANLKINGQELGEHKGGYAAFCFELTKYLLFDQKNSLEVTVSNKENLEVIPLVGDFNVYGGIYRPVNLIITSPVCISPLDYASPGVYLKQKSVSKEKAEIEVSTKTSNGTDEDSEISYQTTILDATGVEIDTQISTHVLLKGENVQSHAYTINNPHLWNGKKDPYLYQVKVEILQNGQVVDTKIEPLGLRFFHVDANEGFFLNGEPIDLRGVSRHQDRKDKASAISEEDHREDMDLMLELGINALRLAHYQHAEIVYDLTDSAGILVWAELPWVGGPGNFMGESNGYENTEPFHLNAKQQLYELIRQNYNHPSILMWSIFNEIQNPEDAKPIDFIKELNAIVKEEDPGRLSVGASMLSPQDNPDLHSITDIIAWNRYFGWYYKEPKDMGKFLDKLHNDFPDYKIAISEYGAGGSIYQHADKLTPPNPMGSPHPEEWQSYYHEENLKVFDERPFVWGTFIWNMFDFGSHFRKEGDHYGINDKGLVTYDRKTKKDAFYFYKANWSTEPVLHIASSRYVFREKSNTHVKVYTNLNDVVLTINGKEYASKSPEKGIVVWEGVKLEEGNNGIIVQAIKDGRPYSDDCTWVIESTFGGMNLFIKIFDLMAIAYKVAIGGFAISFLVWFFGIRNVRKRLKWKRFGLWLVVAIFFIASVLVLLAKIGISNMMGG